MACRSNAAAELRHLEGLLMRWPRSIRLQLQVQELRARIAREKEAKARALRGQIRRQLMGADPDTLARLVRELGCAS